MCTGILVSQLLLFEDPKPLIPRFLILRHVMYLDTPMHFRCAKMQKMAQESFGKTEPMKQSVCMYKCVHFMMVRFAY